MNLSIGDLSATVMSHLLDKNVKPLAPAWLLYFSFAVWIWRRLKIRPAENYIVTRWSVLFTSPVSGFNIVIMTNKDTLNTELS